MGSFAKFLKTEAETIRVEKAKRKAALKEWLDLLNGLFQQVDQWLANCDPDGLLDQTTETITISDPALGEYKAPMRRIEVRNKLIEIVPKARYVAASIKPPSSDKPIRAHGLVEIRESGFTRYYLFQLPGGKWYIQNEVRNLRESDNAVEPLDEERFEAALTSLVQ
jgi:hypothetical protein